MFPLFDKDCDLVGWIEPGRHIFDETMSWRAYISHGHAWSSVTGNWLGPVIGLLCRDQSGRPAAWNPKESVSGSSPPAPPAKAARVRRPARPAPPPMPPKAAPPLP